MAVEIDEGLEAFRARFPSAREAVAECENAAWLVRIAFDAAKDKKSIVRYADEEAGDYEEPWWVQFVVFSSQRKEIEALDRWLGKATEENELPSDRSWKVFRAAFLPLLVAWVLWIDLATARLWTSLEWHRPLVASPSLSWSVGSSCSTAGPAGSCALRSRGSTSTLAGPLPSCSCG